MRETGATLSRITASRAAFARTTRAALAGAALLTGAATAPVYAAPTAGDAFQPDGTALVETAMVLPRLDLSDRFGGLNLPQPLAPSEAAAVRAIIKLDEAGLHRAASAATAKLTDATLLGHIGASRLLSPGHHPAPAELADFLQKYPNDTAAPGVYAALLASLPWRADLPAGPAALRLSAPGAGDLAEDTQGNSGPARAALIGGHDHVAYRLAREAFLLSRRQDGAAAYVAGLAAYRLGKPSAAWFEAASLADTAGPGLAAAGAFWAARAHQKDGDALAAAAWANRAAAYPHTLHGRLTLSLLHRHDPAHDRPGILAGLAASHTALLSEADFAALSDTTAGKRMFAALQVGARAWAEEDARQIWEQQAAHPALRRALLLVANAEGFQRFMADARASLLPGNLPPSPLAPRGGFRLQPALVYAVTRVESNFDPRAQSGAGAAGLMQLMPDAAGLTDETPARAARLLRDPARNLDFGQRYLARLASADMAGDDLLLVLASYNSGRSRVAGWQVNVAADPLMFLETIPTDETRHFVQRILSHSWAYAARFNAGAPGLAELAAGTWPRFSRVALSTPPNIQVTLH